MKRTRQRLGMFASVGALVAAYSGWLTAIVASKPSVGSNLGAEFAGMGLAAALASLAAALTAAVVAHEERRRADLAWWSFGLLLLALLAVVLPTASLINPDL